MQLVKSGLLAIADHTVMHPLSSTTSKVCKVALTPTPGQTGKIYIGGANLAPADLTTVMRVLWPDASGGLPDKWELVAPDGKNSIDLNLIKVGAAVDGEGPLVEAWKL